jgi:hypothetical protein
MQRILGLMALLVVSAAFGCAGSGRQIIHPRGCLERLAIPEKKMECQVCVERPMPHKYLPDNPEGLRCVRR